MNFPRKTANFEKAAPGGLLGLPPREFKELQQQRRRRISRKPPQAVCWGYRPVNLRNFSNNADGEFRESRNL